jgi:RNA polymerase sigma-70 factor (ECF subfamily)
MSNAHNHSTVDGRDTNWNETLHRLRAFVAARVADPELAADITQDVFVRSIASGALDRVDNPAAWLYRSARNAVIDHYRTRRIHDQITELERWPDPGSSDNEPNQATRALARCLQPLLADLHPTARDALTRVDLDGQTHQQAAAQLGISVSGMKSRVQRARRQLKDRLTSCCQVDVDRGGAITDYRPTTGGACACQPDSADPDRTELHPYASAAIRASSAAR